MAETLRNVNILTQQPVPELSPRQLSRFDRTSLYARETLFIDPEVAASKLLKSAGREITTFDVGGTAIKHTKAVIGDGGSVVTDTDGEAPVPSVNFGENYLEVLSRFAQSHDGPVAVSTAGVVNREGFYEENPNLPVFMEMLNRAGGFVQVIGTNAAMNDAEAGVIAGATGIVLRQGRRPKYTIYIIDGGGIGGAAMDPSGRITAMEPGHVPLADPELNPFGTERACGFKKQTFTCLERLGASGAGIEAQWLDLTGENIDGREIAEKMYQGDKRALALFENSARIIATIIEGMRETLGFPAGETDVVLHGGGFKTQGMVERIGQILAKHHKEVLGDGASAKLIRTKDLGMENACMAGLAIAAIMD